MVALKTLTLLAALAAPPSDDVVLLDFGATWCPPCRMMEPTIAGLERAGYRIRRVDIDREKQLAAEFGVRDVPCFVILAGGREIDRVVGRTTYARLERMFQTAQNQISDQQPIARGGLPRTPVIDPPAALQSPPMPNRARIRPAIATPKDLAGGASAASFTASSVEETQHRASAGSAVERALAATVRLTVEDPTHNSYGTGTIVDVHGKEALVLTCGHIFRATEGRGRITVDLLSGEARTSVPGELLEFDLDRDLALVIIRPGQPVTPARIAPASHRLHVQERIFTIGCDRGGPPRVEESRINALDRYLGARNIEVAGQPVSGRSGGGLFNTDGQLIGVCNARDREDDEGLYSALPEIHALLTQLDLAEVLTDPPAPAVAAPAAPHQVPPTARASQPERAVSNNDACDRLTRDEQTLVDALRRHGADAELMCIVRSRSEPSWKSDLIVLERPSTAFINQLTREFISQQHNARRTTAHVQPKGGEWQARQAAE
jgi:thiol-disulfide isomerase/thioredoxin